MKLKKQNQCKKNCVYRVGLRFSLSESDSKLPNMHACRTLETNWKFGRSSESLKIEFDWHSLCSTLPSPWLELSSVGCGAIAKQVIHFQMFINTVDKSDWVAFHTGHSTAVNKKNSRKLPVERVRLLPPQ